MNKVQTVCFDFDGVVHKHRHGWASPGAIDDTPQKDVIGAIHKLREMGYRVVIQSARCRYPGGCDAIRNFLNEHHIEVDEVTLEKPPAKVYFDDRGITYVPGIDIVGIVENFVPWNRQ